MYNENLTVVNAVASVVTAFRDADNLLQRLKIHCVARRVESPPSLLEHTISDAPDEIERVQQRCIERLGPSFQQGDHVAVIAIQQVTIQLQMGLLERLRRALDDPEAADFMAIVDQADSARDSVLSALMSLRQRLLSGEFLPQLSSLGSYESVRSPSIPATSRQPSVAPPVPHKDERRRRGPWVDPYFEPPRAGSEQSASSLPRAGALLSFLKKPSIAKGSTDASQQYISDYPTNERSGPPSAYSFEPSVRHGRSATASTEDTNSQSGDSYVDYFREYADSSTSTVPSRKANPYVIDESRPDSPPHTPNMSSTIIAAHPALVQNIAEVLTTPSAENKYLGFCKGAWRVQSDDPQAMVERRDFTQSAQSKVMYPSCSKCSFRGHINVKTIWNKVYVDENRGLKYRWTFLAKSHVKQKGNSLEKNYSYQCLFCVFLGKEGTVYNKERLLDHISDDHRHGLFSSVLLFRTHCVNNRVCKDSEKFDINLFPPRHNLLIGKGGTVTMDRLATDVHRFELAG